MERIWRVMEHPLYNRYLAWNQAREKDRRFCRHDLQHMVDTARIAYLLLLETGSREELAKQLDCSAEALKEIVYAAGLLHDIGRWKEYDEGWDHALAGAELAGEILREAGFSEAEAGVICTAIGEHRRAGPRASPLGRLLCRADDLARPCDRCAARAECHKVYRLEAAGRMLY